jgi:hypothetical protein
MEKITHLPIQWVHVSDYWDGPLSGWLRAKGRYLFFKSNVGKSYDVFEVPRAIRLPHLRHTRMFRHMVGWHYDSKPGTKPRSGVKSLDLAFYDLPKPPSFDPKTDGRHIGKTDLQTLDLF